MGSREIKDRVAAEETRAARRLTQKDLEWLRCPVCRSSLALVGAEGMAAEVRCTSCGRGYPVVEGLPVLLENRASRYI